MIKAKEAQRQVEMAEEATVVAKFQAQKNAEAADAQTEIAMTALADARTQWRLAQEANSALEECKNSK